MVMIDIVISRTAEMKVIDKKTGITLSTNIIPYGSIIFNKEDKAIKKGDVFVNGIHLTVLLFLNLEVK